MVVVMFSVERKCCFDMCQHWDDKAVVYPDAEMQVNFLLHCLLYNQNLSV